MAKIKELYIPDESSNWRHQYVFWCDGCQREHAFSPILHQFNDNFINPTVFPDLCSKPDDGEFCHSFIYNGYIYYFPDCEHHLSGTTIDLPDVDERSEQFPRYELRSS